MSRLIPGSLKLIVPLSLLGFAIVLSILNVAYHAPRAERAVEQVDRERLFQDLSRLQSSLEYLLFKGDLEGARREVAILTFNHDYTVAALTNESDAVIAATRRAWLGRPVTEVLEGFNYGEAELAARERRARVTISPSGDSLLAYAGVQLGSTSPHELRSARVGRLFLEYDLRSSKAKALRDIANQSLYWALWVTALAVALWIAFHFLLTRRTERLVEAAEQFASGNLTVRSDLQGTDELARLSRAFDAMAQQVGDTQRRLQSDIAERIRAEQKLRASEESYRAIFDAAEDAIFVYDIKTGALIDVNQKACAAYGYTREEMRSLDVATVSAGTRAYTQQDVMRLIARAAAGEQLHFEWHRKSKDDSLHWDEVFLKRVTIGGHDRILALTREVTDRRAAEAALRASEEQYRAMFNASIDGLMLRDAEGEVVEVNPALRRIYGYDPEEASAALRDAAFPASFREALAAGKTAQAELTGVRKDGSVVELEVHGVPMQYQGKPHMLTIARDVTEKKRAAEELSRQREKFYQREKLAALGSLLAGVAHELNNPLSVVVARAVMLEERADAAARAAVIKIRTAAERCARIVRTFLAMARQQPPERAAVAMKGVIQAALDITSYALRTSGVEVELDLAEDMPTVLADADQLHQVFMNLIINAQQALQDQGAPRKIVLTGRFDAEADAVRVAVADNGPGIAAEMRARVFEPYFTTKPTGSGIGVGLSVSLGIVEGHGGTLTVDCPQPGGTVFTITLPAKTASAGDVDRRHNRDEPSGALHVLVVDDERDVRQILAEILGSEGHRVDTAESGREALSRLREASYDVIVTDIRMPDSDGRTLYREIERLWPERSRRVVFVTGDTLTASFREFAEECGRPVIEKPFLPSDVRRVVAEVARDGRRRA